MTHPLSRRGPGPLLRLLTRFFCCNWHRLTVRGEQLPEGPVILVSNHICGLDPLLIQAAVHRPLSFLMAREYYRNMWYIRRGFDWVGAIPVNPGGANRYALHAAIDVVKGGHALCLFPEGAANPPIPMHRLMPGAALIARASGAPIVPVRVSGVWPFDHVSLWPSFYRRSRARVVIGKPIWLSADQPEGRGGINDDTRLIRHAMRAL
ncbi:MAG: lysophospholipid acyltransferase family protein [Mariprofundus sp.]